MNDWVAIALLVILLAGNAFFVAGEFQVNMSTRRAMINRTAAGEGTSERRPSSTR